MKSLTLSLSSLSSLSSFFSPEKSPAFHDFLQQLTAEASKAKIQNLFSLMVLPVQRIPRYEMMFTDLIRQTPEDHQGFYFLLFSFFLSFFLSYLFILSFFLYYFFIIIYYYLLFIIIIYYLLLLLFLVMR